MTSVVAAFRTGAGDALRPGARAREDGTNFCVFSRRATRVWLNLYADDSAAEPLQTFELDPDENRTYFFWHVFVHGAHPGLRYTWRTDGPAASAEHGYCFDPRIELLDPWARCIDDSRWNRSQAIGGEPADTSFRGVVMAVDDYDWEGDQPINHALQDSVIYEMHVGGFTRHPSAGVKHPGTFSAVVEKIPYLKSLGITDVELMPVMAFDEQDVPAGTAAMGLRNYWGYSPVAFYAPHARFASGSDARSEFRDMVKALHRAGIGVILDVVFNHTAEGNHEGPVISQKGFANEVFYHLEPDDQRLYRDYTGCGNSINCNHPLVMQFLVQCVEYWVREMHVDGFRFDLASAMARGEDGEIMQHAPVLWSIEFSGELVQTKLIAEAWDAAGGDLVGNFPGFRWSEWNGHYRDVIRQLVRGDRGLIAQAASRISGSSDLFAADGGRPANSINFVTCHDGFTLHDLVSYNEKHNEDNGESGADGQDHNLSWNCGAEGVTEDQQIIELRQRQARNFLAILMLSQGVPMILAGDEVLRTQSGNNNAYCQDNALSWLDWSLLERHRDMLRFTRELIALRKRHASLRRRRFLSGTAPKGGKPDIQWYGRTLEEPDWHDHDARSFAFTLAGVDPDEPDLHVMLNFDEREVTLPLPESPGEAWFRAVDTGRAAPRDILPVAEQPRITRPNYRLTALSVVVLEARQG